MLRVLLLLTTYHVVHASAHCFDDKDNCISRVRQLMISDDAFFFGQSFHDECVFNGQQINSPQCANPSLKKSILSRFMDSEDYPPSTVDKLGLADVVYTTPAGKYYACGSDWHVKEVNGYRIDPSEEATIDSWSLGFTPSVTWEGAKDKLYSVVFWDVGALYLHGFFINAGDGTMASGTPIYPYSGPKNPRPTSNHFLMVVIEQAQSINAGMATGMLYRLLGQNNFEFQPTELLAALPGMWTEPKFVNIINKAGDAFSFEDMKTSFIRNSCPVLVSQEPAIKQVLTRGRIPVTWSYNDSMIQADSLFRERTPFITSLTMELEVEYSSKDIVVDSCCVKSTFTATLYRLNPFSTELARPVSTRNQPRIQISPMFLINSFGGFKSNKYTLMMVDMTESEKLLHWLVTDIHDADVHTGREILSYFHPVPMDRDQNRVYVFLLLQQDGSMDSFDSMKYVSDTCQGLVWGRCGARVGDMMRDYKLNLVGINWFVTRQDPYIRKLIYSELIPQPMVNVCDGLPGFEEPCPQHYSDPSHASTVTPCLVSLTLLAVATVLQLI